MNRREFMGTALIGAGIVAGGIVGLNGVVSSPSAYAAEDDKSGGPFSLPKLDYSQDALEPYISAKTMSFHYGKHHNGYIRKTNKFVGGSAYAKMSLEEIICRTVGDPHHEAIFNNAAQAWNHTFYWHSLKPKGGGKPSGRIAEKIDADFGGYDNFKTALMDAAGGRFGSGWAWLVLDGGKLKTVNTMNADTPLAHKQVPILTIDVWEHAYYLDYQNARGNYVKALIDNLLNWDFAEKNLVSAFG